MIKLIGLYLAIIASLNIAHAKGTTYYISKVAKNSIHQFNALAATENYHVVVTTTPQLEARQTITATLKKGEKLYLLETHSANHLLIPQQLGASIFGKLDNILIFATKESFEQARHRFDHHAYLIPVSEQPAPYPLRKTSNTPTFKDLGIRTTTYSSTQYLREKLEEFSGVTPIIVNGETVSIKERSSDSGRSKARAYLQSQYEALGLQVTTHNYSRTGNNLIAIKPGTTSKKEILITAHYDSVGNAGADDNGSGIITSLAIAKALAPLTLKHTLKFIAFDQEERGLIGSKAYARTSSNRNELDQILGVVNLEMLGYNGRSDGGFHVIDCNENTSAEISNLLMAVINSEGHPLTRTKACTNRSDHASFWRYGVPAIVVSQNFFGGDGNPCYHRRCDKTDRVHFDYMQTLTTALTQLVHNMANNP